jgi:hypothetical protein
MSKESVADRAPTAAVPEALTEYPLVAAEKEPPLD